VPFIVFSSIRISAKDSDVRLVAMKREGSTLFSTYGINSYLKSLIAA